MILEIGLFVLCLIAIAAFLRAIDVSTGKAVKRDEEADAAAVARDIMDPSSREDR